LAINLELEKIATRFNNDITYGYQRKRWLMKNHPFVLVVREELAQHKQPVAVIRRSTRTNSSTESTQTNPSVKEAIAALKVVVKRKLHSLVLNFCGFLVFG
jgi:hypothetical protein